MEIKLKSQRKPKTTKVLGKLGKTKFVKHLQDHLKGQGVHKHVLKSLRASGFFSNLWNGIKSVAEKVIPHIPALVKSGKNAVSGYKKNGLLGAITGAVGGKKPKAIHTSVARKKHIEKMKRRGLLVSQLMKKEGLTLGQASKRLAQK